MALLSGTSAKIAMDLLRSGRAFEKDGVKMFERALKATQRGQVPEGAVSEFRKLIDGLEAEAIERRLSTRSQRRRLGQKSDASGPPPWSGLRMERDYIPKSVDYWTNYPYGYDQRAVEDFRRRAVLTDKEVLEHSIDGPAGDIRSIRRRSAIHDRNAATIIEALIRLFGEKGRAEWMN